MYDLNDYVLNNDSGLVLSVAHGINDSGQIIGTANVIPDAFVRAYLLTPIAVPEPATATLSLLALAGLCARRRRK